MEEGMSRDLFGNGLLRNRPVVTDLKACRHAAYHTCTVTWELRCVCRSCGKDAVLTEEKYLVCPGHTGLVDPMDLQEGGEKAADLSIELRGVPRDADQA
jgi:hypothetical protein